MTEEKRGPQSSGNQKNAEPEPLEGRASGSLEPRGSGAKEAGSCTDTVGKVGGSSTNLRSMGSEERHTEELQKCSLGIKPQESRLQQRAKAWLGGECGPGRGVQQWSLEAKLPGVGELDTERIPEEEQHAHCTSTKETGEDSPSQA